MYTCLRAVSQRALMQIVFNKIFCMLHLLPGSCLLNFNQAGLDPQVVQPAVSFPRLKAVRLWEGHPEAPQGGVGYLDNELACTASCMGLEETLQTVNSRGFLTHHPAATGSASFPWAPLSSRSGSCSPPAQISCLLRSQRSCRGFRTGYQPSPASRLWPS